jgi:hypothetical protein
MIFLSCRNVNGLNCGECLVYILSLLVNKYYHSIGGGEILARARIEETSLYD